MAVRIYRNVVVDYVSGRRCIGCDIWPNACTYQSSYTESPVAQDKKRVVAEKAIRGIE